MAGESKSDEVKAEDKSAHAERKPSAAAAAAGEEVKEEKLGQPENSEIEAYLKLRKSLSELVAKKASIDRMLEEIEDQLYTEEGVYLQDTSAGNIAKGFDQYTKTSQHRRKSVLTDQDRIFSLSSTSFDAEQ